MKLSKPGDKKDGFLGVFVALGLLVAGVAVADDNKPTSTREEGGFVIEKRGDKTIKYKKKTSYDFEGANIDGIYNKPSGSYISNIKDVKARSIIRIRENFDNEVIDSVRSLK